MKSKKGTEFKFSKEFYNLESIKNAINDYKEIADIKLSDEDKSIKININSKDEEFSNEILRLEFRNYVLGLMENKIGD